MNINQLMKQAQQLQKKVAKKQAELENEIHEIEHPLIKGQMKGNLEILSLEIDPSLLDSQNKEELEALVMMAINQTIKKITDKKEKEMDAITGGTKGLF